MEKKALAADGVVAGSGYVGGRQVSAFSQDFTVVGGSLGKMHAQEDRDADAATPPSSAPRSSAFKDSGGARIQEGVDALSGYGQVFYTQRPAVGRRAADRRRLPVPARAGRPIRRR